MNRIEKLILQHCPNGVEFKELGAVGRRNHGTKITASKMKEIHIENAPIRIFAGGKTIADVAYDSIPKRDIITDTSIIIKSRGYVGFEYYEKPFSHKNEIWSYTIQNRSINDKFVYYYLLVHTKIFQKKARASSVKIPQLSIADTEKFPIPIPPLAIQKEIVKILDTFMELEAELAAELAARKKQYEYYREELLTFGAEVEFEELGEISNIFIGSFVKKTEQSNNFAYPVYNGGTQPTGYYDKYNSDKNSIAVSARGANCGFVNYVQSDFWAGNSCYVLKTILDKVNSKFLFYILKTNQRQIYCLRQTSGIPAINSEPLSKFKIPIPPLAEQKRIVAILDKFDALVNDISIGLPAEQQARKKQYEHYREKLLSFKKLTNNATNFNN